MRGIIFFIFFILCVHYASNCPRGRDGDTGIAPGSDTGMKIPGVAVEDDIGTRIPAVHDDIKISEGVGSYIPGMTGAKGSDAPPESEGAVVPKGVNGY